MLLENYALLKKHISGERAKNDIREIDNFHRIPPSRMHREAAQYCLHLFEKENIQARIIEHRADGKTFYLKQKSVKEWDCRDAFLDIEYPSYHRLCDIKADPNYLMARSFPVDLKNQAVDLVWLKNGVEEDKYPPDLDLKGKIIFISGDRQTAMNWAIAKRGALGLVSDRIGELKEFRRRADVYDNRGGGSFQWKWNQEDIQTFGFSISPREGDQLKELCQKVEDAWQKDHSKPRYPQVKAYVDAKLYDGYYDLVEATIPGTSKEEIILSAHLCHNRSCANDNASGVAGGIEVMRTLQDLMARGLIAKPKRTIKLILMAECVGTYPYLQENVKKWSNIKAAINLDMIGGDQSQDKGTVIYVRTPDGVASFINEVVTLIQDENSQDFPSFAPNSFIPLMHSKEIDYMGGSDHALFDLAGIPSAFICQWPDMTYHTSGDKVDQIDAFVLGKNVLLSATYAYSLANLEVSDVLLIIQKMKQSFQNKLTYALHYGISKQKDLTFIYNNLSYYVSVFQKAVQDFERFFTQDGAVTNMIKVEKKYYAKVMQETFDSYLKSKQLTSFNPQPVTIQDAYKLIVKKKTNFINTRAFEDGYYGQELRKRYQEMKVQYGEVMELADYLIYHIDNETSIYGLYQKVVFESRIDHLDFVEEYLKLLKAADEVTY